MSHHVPQEMSPAAPPCRARHLGDGSFKASASETTSSTPLRPWRLGQNSVQFRSASHEIGIRGLLDERAQVHHVVGHRWSFRNGLASTTKPYRKTPMTTDTPLTRYSATNGVRASGFLTTDLHHLHLLA